MKFTSFLTCCFVAILFFCSCNGENKAVNRQHDPGVVNVTDSSTQHKKLQAGLAPGNRCNGLAGVKCGAIEGDWRYNNQSKSMIAISGSSIDTRIVVYRSMDYKVSVCIEELPGIKSFRITDFKTKEVVFESNGTTRSCQFSNSSTRQLVVSVAIQETPEGRVESGCFGLQILQKQTDRL